MDNLDNLMVDSASNTSLSRLRSTVEEVWAARVCLLLVIIWSSTLGINQVLTLSPHLQVLVLVCWEVCSSPTPSTTSVMILVAVTLVAVTLATSNPLGIYV